MSPFWLSFKLACWTTLILLPVGLFAGRALAISERKGKAWVESLLLLPLVLPPTVFGYYLLVLLSPNSMLGSAMQSLLGFPLVFSFQGLVFASLIINLPFAIQPVQQAFSAIPLNIREAAWVSGMSPVNTFLRIELPLTWTGMLSASMLTFAHTLGEFGVVLMIGGNIEGETRTLSIAIYDSVQAFDMRTAGLLTAGLLLFSVVALFLVRFAGYRSRYVGN